jgi:hypothetical protein
MRDQRGAVVVKGSLGDWFQSLVARSRSRQGKSRGKSWYVLTLSKRGNDGWLTYVFAVKDCGNGSCWSQAIGVSSFRD